MTTRRLRLSAAGLGLSALALGGPVAASPLAECALIPDDGTRLACYDQAMGRAPPPGSMPGKPAAAVPEHPAAAPATVPDALFDPAWAFYADSDRYVIQLHNQNYLLFARYTNEANSAPYEPLFDAAGDPGSLDDVEAKFQIGFRMRLWTTDDRRWGVWGAYTQQNNWQVYNSDISRPFRETNYMPEIFVSHRPGVELGGGFRWNLLNLGLNHQSNGRTDILSRSWDRLIAEVGVERGDFALLAKAWYRFDESASKDDNPDITDYLGYGSLTAFYRWRGHSFTLMGRANLREDNGALQATWMSPRLLGPLRAYVQAFAGYGESMIDYDWHQKTIGIGLSLNDIL